MTFGLRVQNSTSPSQISPTHIQEEMMMSSRIRVSATALLLTVSGSALADGPARIALPLPTIPAVALSQVLEGLPAVNQLLGGLGLTTGGGIPAGPLQGLVSPLSQTVSGAVGMGAALVLGGRDSNTHDPLPGLLPGLGNVLTDAATPGD